MLRHRCCTFPASPDPWSIAGRGSSLPNLFGLASLLCNRACYYKSSPRQNPVLFCEKFVGKGDESEKKGHTRNFQVQGHTFILGQFKITPSLRHHHTLPNRNVCPWQYTDSYFKVVTASVPSVGGDTKQNATSLSHFTVVSTQLFDLDGSSDWQPKYNRHSDHFCIVILHTHTHSLSLTHSLAFAQLTYLSSPQAGLAIYLKFRPLSEIGGGPRERGCVEAPGRQCD